MRFHNTFLGTPGATWITIPNSLVDPKLDRDHVSSFFFSSRFGKVSGTPFKDSPIMRTTPQTGGQIRAYKSRPFVLTACQFVSHGLPCTPLTL